MSIYHGILLTRKQDNTIAIHHKVEPSQAYQIAYDFARENHEKVHLDEIRNMTGWWLMGYEGTWLQRGPAFLIALYLPIDFYRELVGYGPPWLVAFCERPSHFSTNAASSLDDCNTFVQKNAGPVETTIVLDKNTDIRLYFVQESLVALAIPLE